MSDDTVTDWVRRLQQGDADAAQNLWERYFRRLVGLARVRLAGLPRRAAADEEDVALSAFDSFCRGSEQGRFPRLQDRDELWRLLVTITARKAGCLIRDERRQKRGGGAVGGESALPGQAGSDALASFEQVISEEPTPLFALQVAEEYERLLSCLGDAELRSIAVWKLEGDSNEQIAEKLNRSPPTVERRLALIRRIWKKEGLAHE
jgi:DNA-directed RNA polymerase specialized sigma24 family protein